MRLRCGGSTGAEQQAQQAQSEARTRKQPCGSALKVAAPSIGCSQSQGPTLLVSDRVGYGQCRCAVPPWRPPPVPAAVAGLPHSPLTEPRRRALYPGGICAIEGRSGSLEAASAGVGETDARLGPSVQGPPLLQDVPITLPQQTAGLFSVGQCRPDMRSRRVSFCSLGPPQASYNLSITPGGSPGRWAAGCLRAHACLLLFPGPMQRCSLLTLPARRCL